MIRQLETVGLIALGTLVVLANIEIATAQNPAVPEMRATLTTERQTYFIGEDVPLRYCLENISKAPLEVWIGVAKERFKPAVMDANGTVMPQIPHFTPDELSGSERIASGERWCSNYQLLEY